MGQDLFGNTVPAQAACGVVMTDMSRDESVFILIKHCRDMKQQETRFRLITLLLLLSCTALYIFTIWADLRKHPNSGSSAQGSTDGPSPAYSKQDRDCPADHPERKPRIHLRPLPPCNKTWSACNITDGLYIRWDAEIGKKHLKDERAIVIPKEGTYFVYVRIALGCHDNDGTANFKMFYAGLSRWNEAYNETISLMYARDGISCTSQKFRSVFMGQLFNLFKGDHLRVRIDEGYKLITTSSFGAYLT
ncbi:uncharacterized protein LOC121959935 [Plectropomus leopardus]|uniref:uncharacterized protein LOC121959935 n=1 Tax=Plectropomus leopardus TaxID=160734 RepID=UPI001C4A8272|nr:uncharacterized protein LOC121959935 [Plectropomus leopardus]